MKTCAIDHEPVAFASDRCPVCSVHEDGPDLDEHRRLLAAFEHAFAAGVCRGDHRGDHEPVAVADVTACPVCALMEALEMTL